MVTCTNKKVMFDEKLLFKLSKRDTALLGEEWRVGGAVRDGGTAG